jgi:myo-inositol-1-phosphate synthase
VIAHLCYHWCMARDRTDVLVRMPAELKRRLAAEVSARGTNLNDLAVETLAARFGIPYEPTGRKGTPRASGRDVLLRMPRALKERLRERASDRRRTTNDLIVETLRERLGLDGDRNGKDRMASSNGSKNGRARGNGKVRVAIIGVGNCANSLLQGVEYYKDAPVDQFVPGLMHVDLGGYHVGDIEFTAAFDVTTAKVGKDLSEAIWAHPNDTVKFANVKKTGITVSRGMTHDGLGKYISEVVEKAPGETDDVVRILKETGTDVVVNYLPVGSEEATKWYTEQILNAGCAMVNCMPVFIAKGGYFGKQFENRGLPIIGDDIKSQVGATITHRVLTSIFRERGVRLDRTMQLNVGGNSDFRNMLERERLESKKISKTNAVTSMLDYDMGEENVHVGPSDYVPWLTDRKWAYIRMEGSSFGDVPLNVELKLEVWDSPNSAGIVIDAVRLAKLALDNGVSGALEGPSAYLMKSPPKQLPDDEAYEAVEAFIKKYAEKSAKATAGAAA